MLKLSLDLAASCTLSDSATRIRLAYTRRAREGTATLTLSGKHVLPILADIATGGLLSFFVGVHSVVVRVGRVQQGQAWLEIDAPAAVEILRDDARRREPAA